MRARIALVALMALCATLLTACGGSSSSESVAITPVFSAAEQLLGADLLPPDGAVAAASVLSVNDLPPEAATTVSTADMPPNT
jgi:hypothetical protein